MNKLIMLIGLPGSGKSTYAKMLLEKEPNIKYCSSDETRKLIYGDEAIQGDPNKVFRTLHNNVKKHLNEGFDVIYDATNVTRKSRKNIISEVKHIAEIAAHIVWAPYEDCIRRDTERSRTVGVEVIKKFLYRWQSPYYDEGFKSIKLIRNCDDEWDYTIYRDDLIDAMKITHDNPHHTLNIYDHCCCAFDYIREKGTVTTLAHAAAYHDIGKPLTKFFKDDVAHYYQHDNVGGYLIYGCFSEPYQTSEDIIKISWLISNHMQPFFKSSYYNNLSKDMKDMIDLLHAADVNAH